MVRAKPKKKAEYLSPSERQGLEQEKRELETAIADVETYGKGTAAESIDLDRLKGEVKHLDVAIGDRTPAKPRAIEKDKLVKEEADLEETLAEGMPTRFEMRRPSQNPGAVRKHMNWDLRNRDNITRYVEIQRILRPLEPKSVENLRKEK